MNTGTPIGVNARQPNRQRRQSGREGESRSSIETAASVSNATAGVPETFTMNATWLDAITGTIQTLNSERCVDGATYRFTPESYPTQRPSLKMLEDRERRRREVRQVREELERIKYFKKKGWPLPRSHHG